jgi:hypothetical protein
MYASEESVSLKKEIIFNNHCVSFIGEALQLSYFQITSQCGDQFSGFPQIESKITFNFLFR